MGTRRIVFYRTLPIELEARSGSALRPARLLSAFRDLGYEVDVVAGYAGERKRAMREIEASVRAGVRYEFLYAEPPTTPIPLNEPHHFPTHPWMDYEFLTYCHGRGIPVVLFYSDVQWRLPDYRRRIGWAKYLAMLPFFHLDIHMYRRFVDAWLVPHRAMTPQIASWVVKRPHWPSAPGFDPAETPPPRAPLEAGSTLRLFYVGGIEPPVYDLTPLLRGVALAVDRGARCELTICCREAEWARGRDAYASVLGPHVRVVHNRDRAELIALYAASHVAVMPYGTLNAEWAMPIKFAEAIGLGMPVIAGTGTAVGQLVKEEGIGWEVGPAPDDFVGTVQAIDAKALERARAAVTRVRPRYTWTERAREIAVIADRVRVLDGDQVKPVA